MIHSNDEALNSFTITFRREIVFYLRQLINDAERITVMFDEGRETLLTMLLDVDEDEDVLILDWGGSEAGNRALIKAQRAIFVANPLGVRNQFVSSKIWETKYKGRPALATRIPEKFVRLQRREFFRLTLPTTQRRPCTFWAGEPARQWTMAAVDLGLGGIGLESEVHPLPFEVGQILPKVRIDLSKTSRIEVDLEIRFKGTVKRGMKEASRLGCHFVRISSAQEAELQRFITQVQREERARLA